MTLDPEDLRIMAVLERERGCALAQINIPDVRPRLDELEVYELVGCREGVWFLTQKGREAVERA